MNHPEKKNLWMIDFPAELRSAINRFVAESPANRFPGSDDRFFDEPLAGFAAADDPLWSDFKNIIGDYHLTPKEMVASSGECWLPATVISFVLPITEKTREMNRQERQWPSKEWVLTANGGNNFLAELRMHVVELLRQNGFGAVVPQSVTRREKAGDLEVAVSASWSERHVAYVAGLGTFGLNGGLITDRGVAHRCCSVLTEAFLPPTPRTYPDHRHHCLFHREATCGKCIDRCPCGAISRTEKNKTKCFVHLYSDGPIVLAERYSLKPNEMTVGSCGLCQTSVPCERGIPGIGGDWARPISG